MKLCVDCKHFRGLSYCVHPNNGINLVDGRPKPKFATVSRKYDCKQEALWYEEKPEFKPTPWWEMFWSKMK